MLTRFFPQSHCQKLKFGEDGDRRPVAKAADPTRYPSDRSELAIGRKRSGFNEETTSALCEPAHGIAEPPVLTRLKPRCWQAGG